MIPKDFKFKGYHRRLYLAHTMEGTYAIAADDMEDARKQCQIKELNVDRIESTDNRISLFHSGKMMSPDLLR